MQTDYESYLLFRGDAADIVKGDWPDGVLAMKVVDKKVAHI